MTKGQKSICKHTHKPKDRVTWTPFMSAVMWEARLLALSRCLASLLGFCGVRVAHLLCFCVMLFVLFVFAMSCVPKVASFSGLSIRDFPFSKIILGNVEGNHTSNKIHKLITQF